MYKVRTGIILRTAGIFERALNKKIYVKLDAATPSVEQLSKQAYMIHFPRETKDPFWYRSFEHELSHIAFESNFRQIASFVSRFKSNQEVARYILNLVDDVRVDSLWNAIYPGSAQIRKRQLERFYSRRQSHFPHDVLSLLPLAYFKVQGVNVDEPIIHNHKELFSKIVKELEYVKMKGPEASFVAALRIMKLIKDYIKDSKLPQEVSHKGSMSNATPEELIKELDKEEIVSAESIAVLTRIDTVGEDHKVSSVTKSDEKHVDRILAMTFKEIEEVSKKKGKEIVKTVKERLQTSGDERVDPKTKVYGRVAPFKFQRSEPDRTIRPMKRVAKELAQYFARLKLKYRDQLDEEGEEIDIDAYMNHLHDADKSVFLSQGVAEGAYIALLLDFSSSMCDTYKHLLSVAMTVELALRTLPNIEVEFFPFSYHSGATQISRVKNSQELTRAVPYGFTPTPTALYWAGQEVLKQPQAKKFLILITDGMPEDGVHSPQVLFNWTKNAVKYLQRRGVKVFVLFIDAPKGLNVEEIFQADVMVRVRPRRMEEDIINFFRKVVESILRG